jgi:hypothetical protein
MLSWRRPCNHRGKHMSLFRLQNRIVALGVVVALGGPPSSMHAQGKQGIVIVYLDPMTTAGVGGTVNLAPNGPATNFEVTLNPGESPQEEGAYKVRVVQGSCSAPGRVVQDLDEVPADGKTRKEDGNLRLSDVRRGDHVIQVAAKRRNEVVACGVIPAAR